VADQKLSALTTIPVPVATDILYTVDTFTLNFHKISYQGLIDVFKGQANQLASLDGSSLVPTAEIPTINNSKLANMATSTIKGRIAAGAGTPANLSASQVRTIINVADGAIANLIEDTTPQLGGQLDVNGNALGDGTLELLKFEETGSAVNELTVKNNITANAPELQATGDDTDISLNLVSKGTGNILINGVTFTEEAQDAVGNILVDTTTIDLVYNDGVPSITAAVIDNSITNIKAADMATSTIKGRITAGTGNPEDLTAVQVRTIINVADGAIANIVDDITPELGAQLDVKGFALGTATLEILKFELDGSSVNEVTIKAKNTGLAPEVKASGGDTDISLNLVSKGTGNILINGVTFTNEARTALGSNGLEALTTAEVNQLENIGVATISASQWLNVGAMNQDVDTTVSPSFTGLTLSTFTTGSIPFIGASGLITQDNANLFWDNSNDRLGIGTATPTVNVHINGLAAGITELRIESDGSATGTTEELIKFFGDNGTQTGELGYCFADNGFIVNAPRSTSDIVMINPDGGSLGIGTKTGFGSGVGVIGIANATTLPTTTPAGGGVLYCSSGALRYLGSSGTDVQLAAA